MFNDDADPDDEMPPEDTEITCSGGVTIPPLGVTDGE